jgi:AraC family transcriptional regulator of adaptative response / DNA-3-methyladenine glycosylase II
LLLPQAFEGVDGRAPVSALETLPGISRWTAEYIAMRALGEPDAFPTGDLVLRRMIGNRSARQLDRRADLWRPWRSYAVMLLWHTAADEGGTVKHQHTARRSKLHDGDGRVADAG